MQCIRCKEDKDEFLMIPNLQVCFECASEISEGYDVIKFAIRKKIEDNYPIIDMDPPKIDCYCGHNLLLPFDYYTDFNEENERYMLILTCVCKKCGGYRERAVEEAQFPFMVKKPPAWIGIYDFIVDEELDYYT